MRVSVFQFLPFRGPNLASVFRSRLIIPAILAASAACCLSPATAHAAGKLVHVHVIIAGKELMSSVPCIADDTEVYVPLDVLKAVDANGRLSPHGDTVIVTEQSTGRSLELALARVNGSEMIALSDLGHVVDGVVVRAAAHKGERSTANTVCFAARVSNIRMDGNHVQIETSFPVQYRVEPPNTSRGTQSFVDCEGAVLDGFLPAQQTAGLRLLQLKPSMVRVEVTLSTEVMVQPTDGRAAPSRAFSAVFVARPHLKPGTHRTRNRFLPGLLPGRRTNTRYRSG